MITNREIRNERLLNDVLDEVTESALKNDIEARTVVAALRERADAIETGAGGDGATDGS